MGNALYAQFVGSPKLNGRFNGTAECIRDTESGAIVLVDRCENMAIFNRAPFKDGHTKQLPDLAETKLLLCGRSVYSFLNAEH